MTSILTADIHMTSLQVNQYRWQLWPWLEEQVREHKVDNVIILGDLTDKKDHHSSALVNRLCEGISRLAAICHVHILKGNHDYIDPANPFFKFVKQFPKVHFYSEPTVAELKVAGKPEMCLFLPTSHDPTKEWEPHLAFFGRYKWIFMHQTIHGALYENGQTAECEFSGDTFAYYGFQGEVWSGDIHVPQRFKQYLLEYVGAPYRINFGDQYTARAVLIDSAGKKRNLAFQGPEKHLLDITENGEVSGDEDIAEGDLVKVRVTLSRASYPIWPKLRQQIQDMARDRGWVLFGPELLAGEDLRAPKAEEPPRQAADPEAMVREYGERQELHPDVLGVGIEIVRSV